MLNPNLLLARALAPSAAVLSLLWSGPALAADPPSPSAPGADVAPLARETPAADPTGGAYTTPTLLFTPAGAVPTWNARVIVSLDVQGPTPPDRFAVGMSSGGNAVVGFQPGIAVELGLPAGFTLGAGTNWVGGDNAGPNVLAGLSPYFQLRYHILGDKDGRGFQLGVSATYKFVGFGTNGDVQPTQDPGEVELAVSGQYRQRGYEVGLEAVIGKDFASTDSDGELHAYAALRPIPQLALGAASQLRVGLVSQPGEPPADVIAGGIASLTLGRWQLGALAGGSTVGLPTDVKLQMGGLGEIFGTARF
jgi:hypothetical protein